MKEFIHVAIGLDDNYAMPCGISLISICMNNDADIIFHAFVSDTISSTNTKILTEIVSSYKNKIIFYTVDHAIFADLHENVHIKRSTYNRFLIPKLIGQEIKKVLYLDGDIIVKKSLKELWDIELNDDCPLAAAIDARCSGVIQHNAIDIPIEQAYYNVGVMLMNLDYWRKQDISNKCIEYIRESRCPWMDQDAINHIIGDKIKKIHLKYNLQMAFVRLSENEWCVEKGKYFEEVYEAKADPIIVHYSEQSKPWHENYSYPEEWLKYKALSPWKDTPLEVISKQAQYTRSLLSKLEKEHTCIVEKYAPAYFILLKNGIDHSSFLLWTLNKVLWLIIKLFRLK